MCGIGKHTQSYYFAYNYVQAHVYSDDALQPVRNMWANLLSDSIVLQCFVIILYELSSGPIIVWA